MKKVLCIIESIGSGGAERQLVGLAVFLRQQGFDVKLVTYLDVPFFKSFLDANNVWYENIVCNKCTRLLKLKKEVKEYKPDVIISYLEGASMLSCLIKLLGYKGKLIVSERNVSQKLTIRERLKFGLFRVADVIVPNSYTQMNYINANFKRLASKVKVITNFVDTEEFVPRECGRESISELRMSVVGRFFPQKNVLTFLRAMKILQMNNYSIHVKWYGNKMLKTYYDQCVKLRAELGLDACVEFLDPTNEVRKVYQDSDVFCLPSIYEGFPNVICEAMSCGVPILCSNVCDNSYIVEDGVNGFLFNPVSSEDIADKIRKFMKLSKEERQLMAVQNRMKALEMFSKENFVRQYINLIEK